MTALKGKATVLLLCLFYQDPNYVQAWSGLQVLWSSRHCLIPGFVPTSTSPYSSSPKFYSSNRPEASNFNVTTFLSKNGATSVDRATQLIQEAEQLRLQAKQIMAEALSMEADLKKAISRRENKLKEGSQYLVQKIFDSRPLTPEAVAQAMRNERVSGDQAFLLVELLQSELLKLDPNLALGGATSSSSVMTMSNKANSTSGRTPPPPSESARGSNGGEATTNNDLASLIASRLDCLIEAAEILDNSAFDEMKVRWSGRVASQLRSHRSQLRRTAQYNLARSARLMQHETALQQQQKTRQGSTPAEAAASSSFPNQTTLAYNIKYQVFLIPSWLPPRLLALFDNQTLAETKAPSSVSSEDYPLSSRDIKIIKQKVLTETSFVCTSSESIPSAAIFRGTIRPQSTKSSPSFNNKNKNNNVKKPDRNNQSPAQRQVKASRNRRTAELYQSLTTNMEKHGLQERVQLFLMTDLAEDAGVDDPSPVVLAIPAKVTPTSRRKIGLLARIIGGLSIALASLSLFQYSVSCFALNPMFFRFIVHQHDAGILAVCSPIFWGIIGIQVMQELAHRWVARNRGIRVGFPFPLPSYDLGTFGCLSSLNSFPKNRKDLFDFSISGPAAGALSSLACMVLGIHKTIHASSQALTNYPVLPVAWFKSSFLVGTLLTFLAPKIMSLPLSQPIPIHPLFVIGFSSLISSALNLLPIFRLDGGRACDAAFGHRHGEFVSAATLMFLFSSVVSKVSAPVLTTWFLIILLFRRNHEIPSRDELTELSRLRIGGWICSVAFSILALMPFPGFSRQLPSKL